MKREELIGKVFTHNNIEVEVAYLNDEDENAVVVCDCETTERFFSVNVNELING